MDILTDLKEEVLVKSGSSLRHGCVDCGLHAVLLQRAISEIERLREQITILHKEHVKSEMKREGLLANSA